MRFAVAKYVQTPLMQRLLFGAVWSVIGSGAARLLALASSVYIARVIGSDKFGQFVIIQSTLGMFGVFAGMGLGVVATKFTAELKLRDPERLGRIISLIYRFAIVSGALISFVLFVSSDNIAMKIIHVPSLSNLIQIASISVFFVTLDGYNNSALLGFEAVRQSVLGSLLSGVLSIILTIIFTAVYGLQGAVIGVVLASILQCIVSRWLLHKVMKNYKINTKFQGFEEWRVLRDFALPALLGGAMVTPVYWVCQVLLINTSNGLAEMAVLGIGLQWFQAIYFLPMALGRIVLPVMTDVVAGGHNEHAAIILKSTIFANAVVAIPPAILVSILSHWIMRMYAVNNPKAWLVLVLMVAAATISSVCTPVGQVMVAKGKNWYGWAMNMGWAIVYVAGSYFLLGFGAVGVAAALLTAYLVHTTWVTTWVFRNISERKIA